MLRCIDLFAGAGGFSLGAQQAGFSVEHAFEIDEWACQTLRANHPETTVHCADVRDLSDDRIGRDVAASPDLLIGGPPCQGFSHAGPARKDPKDPRNSLFREFLRFVRILEPEVVVLENVPGLLRAKTAKGEPVPDAIRSELERLGYTTSLLILDAHLHGVPQIRRRLFFVGTPETASIVLPPTHGTPEIPGHRLAVPVTLWDAISDLPHVDVGDREEPLRYTGPPANTYQQEMRRLSPHELWNHLPMRHSTRTIERFKHIRPGESQSHVGAEHAPRRRIRSLADGPTTYDQNNRRMYSDRPCHTLPASFYANFIHPFLHRNFTPREGARIQSFPDWYVFRGKPTVVSQKLLAREGRHSERHLCQYNQIGNAVPPLLARDLIGAIWRALNDDVNTRHVA